MLLTLDHEENCGRLRSAIFVFFDDFSGSWSGQGREQMWQSRKDLYVRRKEIHMREIWQSINLE